ncbi:MAG: hypothetical protein JO051_11985 [Acidobacteriaceae bacterium]|nr:hypothetical protein [Acidobacteriaceae bacterium]
MLQKHRNCLTLVGGTELYQDVLWAICLEVEKQLLPIGMGASIRVL